MRRGCQTSQTFLEAKMEVSGTPVLVVVLLTVILSTGQYNSNALKFCVNETVATHCASIENDLNVKIECIIGRDNIDCMRLVQDGKADIVQLEPPEIYTAGHFFNLEVVAANLEGEGEPKPYRYRTVIVVSKNSSIKTLADLKGKNACFDSITMSPESTIGWEMIAGILLNKLNNIECKKNNELLSIGSFFKSSCITGNFSWDAQVDSILKKEEKLCSFCRNPDTCDSDRVTDLHYALKCLNSKPGDVAFTTVKHILQDTRFNTNNHLFLCLNDTTVPVDTENPCVWAEMPTAAYMTKSGNAPAIDSELKTLIDKGNNPGGYPLWKNEFFDHAVRIEHITNERRDWKKYLGNYIYAFNRSLSCEKTVKFCTKSDEEQKKCESFKMAAYGQYLRPVIECVKEASTKDCISAINQKKADIITLNGRDLYAAGKYDNMLPIVSEVYEDNKDYYAVAVMKADSPIQNITDLKGKKSCHTSIGRNAGWIMPLGEFIKLGLIDKKECDIPTAVANYFSESCVPGAKNSKGYNPKSSGVDKLCKLCKNPDKCATDDEYGGYDGAFRCLVEGGGDIAFVKHSIVPSLTDGHSNLAWAKSLKSSDYKLLCPNGTTAQISDYLNCNFGFVPSSRYVIASSEMAEDDRFNVVYMLTSAGKLFKGNGPVFRLFGSYDDKIDLLFKDSTVDLKSVEFNSKYDQVLNGTYLEALQLTDPRKCNSATTVVAALTMIICSVFLSFAM